MQTTDTSLRNLVIYSVYVRCHTPEGTFRALEADLDRIRALGTDMIWLMPIHPIGQEGRKGSLGCPYSISDYRAVNPAYGTLEDFRHLIDEIHARGMKCIIDVVYNHTSHDSVLLADHPGYFWRKPDGSLGNRFGDWTDVYDLDYRNRDLREYQAETLMYWAGMVDGFRCDVASCVPPAFWSYARSRVAEVNPDCFWLAETVHSSMISEVRKQGLEIWTDNEIYQAFDAEYQYDIWQKFCNIFSGQGTLPEYLNALNDQLFIYPRNFIKMRFVENHDTPRFASVCPDEKRRSQWLQFMFFQQGPMLIYGGQEFSCTHTPSLFEQEVFSRSGKDISSDIAQLAAEKKALPHNAVFEARHLGGNRVEGVYVSGGRVCARREFAL